GSVGLPQPDESSPTPATTNRATAQLIRRRGDAQRDMASLLVLGEMERGRSVLNKVIPRRRNYSRPVGRPFQATLQGAEPAYRKGAATSSRCAIGTARQRDETGRPGKG